MKKKMDRYFKLVLFMLYLTKKMHWRKEMSTWSSLWSSWIKFDEIFSYNEIPYHIEKENNDLGSDTEQLFKFHQITAQQGPLSTSDKDYKGSTYNVLVEWESGEATYALLVLIASGDLVTCA
jgi:hypothetical protein